MKLLPLNRDTIAIIFVAAVVIGFFVAGMTNTLDYFIVKTLLFSAFVFIVGIAISYGIKNASNKKRPEN